jgi:creatinine amidohydrolase
VSFHQKITAETMTTIEFSRAIAKTPLVYLPIGAFEFHGDHLPLGTDALHIHKYCLIAAEKTGGVVLPPTYWNSNGHVNYPGTVMIRESTFELLIEDIFTSLARQSVKLVVASTGHYPLKQGAQIARIAKRCMQTEQNCSFLVLDPYTSNPDDRHSDHGGKIETSIMLHLHPELVEMDALNSHGVFRGVPKPNAQEGTSELGKRLFTRSIENYVSTVKSALRVVESNTDKSEFFAAALELYLNSVK